MIFLVVSIVGGLVIFPLLHYKTPTLSSPYSKTNLVRRFTAATIDVMIASLFYPMFLFFENSYLLMAMGIYFLLKDGLLHGRSIGKLLMGLIVLRITDNKPCTLWGSVLRNITLALPGVNVVGWFYELLLVVKDAKGIRLGDRFAKTQVVEGKEATQLAKFIEMILTYYDNLIGKEIPEEKAQNTRETVV